ncbi:DUF4145 domain-containing protein [Bacillus gobiensis]|uniref:DUF4145 domain-containing protein n=1 Tax=Bacillus gobiensis TaxID=1441095 RepID=UPI003D1C93D9
MAENIILTCPHCGNKTPMKLLNKFEKVTKYPLKYGEGAHFKDIFEVFECPVCKGFQLYYTHWDTTFYVNNDDIYKHYGRVLFPITEKVFVFRLPSNVRSAYESALKVKNIDDTVCVIALRRTLEMVCKDKGAVKGQLHQKLNQLQQQGILPPLMGDISRVIKDFGNMAAHGDQVNFNKTMLDSMFRFTNKILEYVYILPKQMEDVRQELESLSEETDSQSNSKE